MRPKQDPELSLWMQTYLEIKRAAQDGYYWNQQDDSTSVIETKYHDVDDDNGSGGGTDDDDYDGDDDDFNNLRKFVECQMPGDGVPL